MSKAGFGSDSGSSQRTSGLVTINNFNIQKKTIRMLDYQNS